MPRTPGPPETPCPSPSRWITCQVVAQGQFSASQNGILVYTSGAAAGANVQLTWFDRQARRAARWERQARSIGLPSRPTAPRLRPTARILPEVGTSGCTTWRAAPHRASPSDQAATSIRCGLRTEAKSPSIRTATVARSPLPKGRERRGPGRGSGQRSAPTHRVEDWSRDGRYLIEDVVDPKTSNDIWVIPTFGDRKPFPYINTEFHEDNAKLSPNGQFLAYRSDESKRNEVYVQTFPEHGGKWQISTGGGDFPVWSRDGRELYFISADNKLMAVEVKGDGKKFDAGVPKPLFSVPAQAQFDVSKDGRFLIHVPVAQTATNVPITVVVNWQSALKK